jgi:hypothetical protein
LGNVPLSQPTKGDLREPDAILQAAAKTLDFTQPVALMLLGDLGARRRLR